MILEGVARRFGDNISTDLIISGKYKFSTLDMDELAGHVMEDASPGFASSVERGRTFIVAGRNWGMGSSREQAPLALKHAGINAVIATSFARIFYRNAINVGLPLIQCDTKDIQEGDELSVDLEKGILRDKTSSLELGIQAFPEIVVRILEEGGLVPYLRKKGEFSL